MPAIMKSIGQPSLETLTGACEKPASGEKQHANQDISQVDHGDVTSVRGFVPPDIPLAPEASSEGKSAPLRKVQAIGFLRSHRVVIVDGDP